jgi:hypothetical protein
MDERLRFVAQLLDGEAMSEVCRAFGISRKTGYKIFERYKEHGLEALTDRSRRPVRYANQLPRQIESLIVAAKRDKPHWGAPQDPRAPGPLRPMLGERPRWVDGLNRSRDTRGASAAHDLEPTLTTREGRLVCELDMRPQKRHALPEIAVGIAVGLGGKGRPDIEICVFVC